MPALPAFETSMPRASLARPEHRDRLSAGAFSCLAPGAMRVGRALAALRSYGSPAVPSAAVRGLRATVQA